MAKGNGGDGAWFVVGAILLAYYLITGSFDFTTQYGIIFLIAAIVIFFLFRGAA